MPTSEKRAASETRPGRETRAANEARAALEVEVALDGEDLLGESPVWRQSTQELLRVDVARGLVHAWHPQTGHLSTWRVDGEAGAVIPCRGGAVVVAVDHELRLLAAGREPPTLTDGGEPPTLTEGGEPPTLTEGRESRTLASAEWDRPHNRFNDCRSDPQGRIWAGTMSKRREPGLAGLYRLEPGGELELVIDGTTISNGLGWSPHGQRMYFIDSTTQRIDVFDFDGSDGSISNRRPFAQIDPEDGLPDGLAVDAEGGVWVCLFGGGALRRYDADGTLDEHVALPVPHATCPAFGGQDLSTLFVTTTRHKLSEQQLAQYPLAGCVLSLRPGVKGLPANLAAFG